MGVVRLIEGEARRQAKKKKKGKKYKMALLEKKIKVGIKSDQKLR